MRDKELKALHYLMQGEKVVVLVKNATRGDLFFSAVLTGLELNSIYGGIKRAFVARSFSGGGVISMGSGLLTVTHPRFCRGVSCDVAIVDEYDVESMIEAHAATCFRHGAIII